MVKEYIKKIDRPIYLLCLVAFFPILKIQYNSYTIIILSIFTFFFAVRSKKNRQSFKRRINQNLKPFFISTLVIYPLIFSLTYSSDVGQGVKSLEQIASLIVFPFIIFFLIKKISHTELKLILRVFVFVCFLLVVYIEYNFYSLGLFNITKDVKFYRLPFREAIMNLKYESLHPTYVSLWFSFSIIILLYFVSLKSTRAKYKNLKNLLCIICILVFSVVIIQLSSRIGIITLFITVIFYLITLKNKIMQVLLISVFCILSFFTVKNISYISSRFISEFEETKLAPPVGKAHNSINIRVGIYSCSTIIIKNNPILGVGIGDVQKELNKCYKRFDTDVYANNLYNTHNYYFNILIASGILGLTLFLIMFYFYFKVAIKNKSYIYVCFLAIFVIAMLFENIISRNHGVIFFSLFNTIFIRYFHLK